MLLRARLLFLYLFNITCLSSSAQELWGFANSNYAGVMGLHLNPASIVGVPYEYEVNIFGGDIFYDNNFMYLPKLSDINTKTTTNEDATSTNSTTFVTYDNSSSKHAYASGLLLGPSYIKNKNTKAWAVHTAMRAIVSANSVPPTLAQAFYTKFDYAPLHNLVFRDMKLNSAGMLLADIGFSYAKVYIDQDPHWLAWGVTLNGIVALDGIYLDANVGEYTIPDSNSLYMDHVNIDYGHALPAAGGSTLSILGFGGSADFGLVYIHKRNSGAYECGKDADRRKRYQYKVGLSLIDLGYVYFNNGASQFMVNDGSMHWNYIDTAKFTSAADFDQQLSAHSGSSQTSNHFGIFMPAAVSMQFDYCIKPKWYANLSMVQRLPFSHKEVFRANSIALVPRYETRKFETSISANMYEYEHVYMGVAVRYLFFVLGSDRLLSFVGYNVRSINIFFGFKFNSCMLKKKYKNKGGCPMNG